MKRLFTASLFTLLLRFFWQVMPESGLPTNHALWAAGEFILIYYFLFKLPEWRLKKLEQENKVVDLAAYRKRKKQQQANQRGESFRKIYQSADATEVNLMAAFLSSHQIECKLHNSFGASLWPGIRGVGLQLMVREDQFEQADKLLKNYQSQKSKPL